MISLIVNADDLGINAARDRGILEAFTHGLVTSASIMANGPSFETAAPTAKSVKLPVGVHLNLSEGRPLSGPIRGLTDHHGNFPGKIGLRQCLGHGDCDPEALRRELRTQIERTLAAGLQPDHLDSHQHCHLFPCLATQIIELATEYGIKAVRNPRPAEPVTPVASKVLAEELDHYRELSERDKLTKNISHAVQRPDGLWGMTMLNNLSTDTLCALLNRIPEGNWELMVHPGYPDPSHPFSGPQRTHELVALVSPDARAIVEQRNIRLITFEVLACVS